VFWVVRSPGSQRRVKQKNGGKNSCARRFFFCLHVFAFFCATGILANPTTDVVPEEPSLAAPVSDPPQAGNIAGC
jgi:hypothetical protein